VQQGLPLGIPVDVSQVVDRMTSGDPCADPTKGSSSWPTLGADCRARSYKLPCVLARTGWVERKMTAKDLLLGWDLPVSGCPKATQPGESGAV
jgi:hypothetical protein